MMHLPTLVTLCDFIATFAFALVGARIAAGKGMDFGGIAMVAAVSSISGGTLRNLFLLHQPPWIVNAWLLLPILLGVLLTITFRKVEPVGRFLLALDTFGLAVATASSTQFALNQGVNPVVAVLLGLIGGIAGGLFRDLLAQIPPVVLHRETIGTSCLLGAATIVALRECHVQKIIAVLVGGAVVVIVRELSIHFEWNLPRVS
jgi:uncharacterized membrane protein YeiH